jgi:serine phosphatase RsbU (regulator of sigma subunit)
MARRPNPGGTNKPDQPGRMSTQDNPRPQATPARQAARRVGSSGALPTARGPGTSQAQPRSPGSTPPPPTPGRPQRAATRQGTRGMRIKTKIVIGMSSLVVAASLLVFIVVLIVASKSLDETIQQSGVGMLQQAETIQRQYVAGLNENGLVAYFTNSTNRGKFTRQWETLQRNHFHARIPASTDFSNWDQLRDDLVWTRVAGEILDDPTRFQGLDEAARVQILGSGWLALRNLGADDVAPAPSAPRQVNGAALENRRTLFSKLFQDNGLDTNASFGQLRQKLHEVADTRVIQGPSGLRRLIFQQYKADFVRDLNELTDPDTSQVRYVVFQIPDGRLFGFSSRDLNVVSPDPADGEIPVSASSDTREVNGVTVDRGAMIADVPAYGFRNEQENGLAVSIYLDRGEIQSRKTTLTLSILGIAVLAVALSLGLAFVIGTSITKPLQTLMSDIEIISGGNFEHKPRARSNDEIGVVAKLLGDMAAGLKSAQDVWLENQGRKHDLDIAKEIQENLLPKHVPRIAGYDVSAYYSPSKEVGGDYYDFFLVDKTHLGMVCADVSGKGIPGSMVMMMTKALISYEAQANLSPRDIFCKVNRTLAKDIKRGMFVTAFYMLLDIPTARLTVASAGHNPLLLYRAATKQCIEVNPGGIALGFDKDGRLFERNMKEEIIQLQRGDRAVIYTDGITEAMSPEDEEFGEERMQAITVQTAGKTSAEYLTTLVNAIQTHSQSDEQHDDITIVTLKVG